MRVVSAAPEAVPHAATYSVVRFEIRALLVLLAALLGVSAGRAGAEGSAPGTGTSDVRLSRPVTVWASGVPVHQVVEGLRLQAGVDLRTQKQVGEERLVAFARELPLEQVMGAIADLYRAHWVRESEGKSWKYVLSKRASDTQKEQALRERGYQELLQRLRQRAEKPPVRRGLRGSLKEWAAVQDYALRLIVSRWSQLVTQGSLTVRVAELPPAERDLVLGHLTPLLQEQYTRAVELQRLRAEGFRKAGKEPPPLRPEEDLGTGPRLEEAAFEVLLNARRGGELTILLNAGNQQSVLSEASGAYLPDAGRELYASYKTRPSEGAGPDAQRHEVPAAFSRTPRLVAGLDAWQASNLEQLTQDPRAMARRPGGWIGRLSLLAEIGGIPVFSDYYGGGPDGRDAMEFPRNADVTLAGLLDGLCSARGEASEAFSLGPAGKASSFWWIRGNAALIRHQRWLWKTQGVLPTGLVEQLATAVQSKQTPEPTLLSRLSELSFAQVQSFFFSPGMVNLWQLGVQIPARLSPSAKKLVLTEGLRWEKLSPTDRTVLTRLLAGFPAVSPEKYSAQITLAPGGGANGGPPTAVLSVQVTLGARPLQASGHVDIGHTSQESLLVASTHRRRPRELPPLVCALYYGWYGLPGVSGAYRRHEGVPAGTGKPRNFAHQPQAGLYDSNDETVIRRHLGQLKKAGVDVLVCSWWGPGSFEDKSFRKLAAVAAEVDLKVCFFIEPIAQLSTMREAAAAVAGALAAAGQNRAYLKVDGKPVAFVFGGARARLRSQEWAELLGAVEKQLGSEVLTVVTGREPLDRLVFQGVYPPDTLPLEAAGAGAETKARLAQVQRRHAALNRLHDRVAVATVSPGFDLRHRTNNPRLVFDRDQGRTYSSSWEAAMEAKPDWVLIESFNHWEIGTEIEPSVEAGERELETTARYAARFKAEAASRKQ